MRNWVKTVVIFWCFLIVLTTPSNILFSDIITFKSGRELKAKILDKNDQEITIEFQGSKVTFPTQDIVSIIETENDENQSSAEDIQENSREDEDKGSIISKIVLFFERFRSAGDCKSNQNEVNLGVVVWAEYAYAKRGIKPTTKDLAKWKIYFSHMTCDGKYYRIPSVGSDTECPNHYKSHYLKPRKKYKWEK